jgi:imidazoleglycerol phosphate dehydratase HisB
MVVQPGGLGQFTIHPGAVVRVQVIKDIAFADVSNREVLTRERGVTDNDVGRFSAAVGPDFIRPFLAHRPPANNNNVLLTEVHLSQDLHHLFLSL